MPSIPMVPAHEREHIELASEYLAERLSKAHLDRWNHALRSIEDARVYDAYLEFNELLKEGELDAAGRAHIQLQAVRCLRDAPIERVKTELAFIEAQDEYQAVVLDYRLGWLMRHRLDSGRRGRAVLRPRARGGPPPRRRSWEIAALLQRADALAKAKTSRRLETYNRVYNLSRRNGHVEYIPKALLGKGRLAIRRGGKRLGEEHSRRRTS